MRLSAQFITERRLPDKAIDVIDEAGAYARIEAYKNKEKADKIEDSVTAKVKLNKETDAAEKSPNQQPSTVQDGNVETIEISLPVIEAVISKIARIPQRSVGESEKDKLKNLEDRLKERIFGQSDAIAAVVKAVKRSRAGFRSVG